MYILYSKNSCFETETSDINLRARHAYYYQVQTQMQVCDVQFCDFVVGTFTDDVQSIFVKRVQRDDSFRGECHTRATLASAQETLKKNWCSETSAVTGSEWPS